MEIQDCPVKKERSHFEDLERFMGFWQNDPKGMCFFMGRALARVGYRNFPDFFFATGAAYFAFQEICDRIDFICEHHDQQDKLIANLAEAYVHKGIVCLKDMSTKRHRGIRVMLLRDIVDEYPTYFIRYFLEKAERAHGYLKDNWCSNLRGRASFDTVLNSLGAEPGEQQYEDDFTFWNFRHPVELTDGVIVYPDAQGFYDLHETKSVGDFLVLVRNMLGYNKCIRENELSLV